MRHSPPTGKKCRHFDTDISDIEENELLQDAAIKAAVPSVSQDDGQRIQQQIMVQLQQVSQRLDQVEERMADSKT